MPFDLTRGAHAQETPTLAEALELLEAKENVLLMQDVATGSLLQAYPPAEVHRMEATAWDYKVFLVNSSNTATFQDDGGSKMNKDRALLYCQALTLGTLRPMRGGNAKLSAKVRAELITNTYVVTTPVNLPADTPDDARKEIVLRNSMTWRSSPLTRTDRTLSCSL